jgi:hypothetical protein
MTAKEKAAAGLWMLKQAVIDLLNQPQHRGGMRPSEVRNTLGLVTEANETTGVAYSILKLMAADRELETTDEHHPLYYLPGSRGNGA